MGRDKARRITEDESPDSLFGIADPDEEDYLYEIIFERDD